MVLSEYEKQREQNIAANKARLAELGIEEAAEAVRTKPAEAKVVRKRPREPRVAPAPSRASRRLSGAPEELMGLEMDDNDVPMPVIEEPRGDPLKQASNRPRLTAEQMARLNSLEEVSEGPLTDAEVAGLEGLEDALHVGSWKVHKGKGTVMWGEKRKKLAELAAERSLRWPSWLGKIQGALPPMGTTETARHQTMLTIEQAACGLGMTYKAWPEGVGVLLDSEEAPPTEGEADGASSAVAARPRPRVLTLGADTEALKREGQRLEARWARDAGNGWVYNHALGKLRTYQELLLKEHWGEKPSGPSIRELEDAEAERAEEEKAASAHDADAAAQAAAAAAEYEAAVRMASALAEKAAARQRGGKPAASPADAAPLTSAAVPFTAAMVAELCEPFRDNLESLSLKKVHMHMHMCTCTCSHAHETCTCAHARVRVHVHHAPCTARHAPCTVLRFIMHASPCATATALTQVRAALEAKLGLEVGGLNDHKGEIKRLVDVWQFGEHE